MRHVLTEPPASLLDEAGEEPLQAASRGEIGAFSRPLAMTSPTPESTRVCLNPPPAPTISRMLAMGANDESTSLLTALRVWPMAVPSSTSAATPTHSSSIRAVPYSFTPSSGLPVRSLTISHSEPLSTTRVLLKL